MTVKQLLERLAELPQDAVIAIFEDRVDGIKEVDSISRMHYKLCSKEGMTYRYGWKKSNNMEENTECIIFW